MPHDVTRAESQGLAETFKKNSKRKSETKKKKKKKALKRRDNSEKKKLTMNHFFRCVREALKVWTNIKM